MSVHNYQVSRTLVGTGNQATVANGTTMTGSVPAVGQMALVNANTGAIILPAADAFTTPFYIMTRTTGEGILTSAGKILSKNVRSVSVQCYTAGVNKVIDVENICTTCDKDFELKIEVFNNRMATSYGFAPALKTFVVPGGSCETDDPDYCRVVVKTLRDYINNNFGTFFTAVATNPADDSTLTDNDLDAWDVSANSNKCPNLRITGDTQSLYTFTDIPELYSYPEGVNFRVSVGETHCSPAVTTTTVTEIGYPKGAGVDVKYQEWVDAGNAFGKVYRQTESGVYIGAKGLNASESTNYTTITIEYDDPHENNFRVYNDPKVVTIALPATSASPENIAAALDYLIQGAGVASAIAPCIS